MADSKDKMKIPDRVAKITEVITKLNEMTPEENRMAPDDVKKYTDEVLRRETAFYKAEDIHRHDDYMFLPPFFPDTIKEGYDKWEPGKGVVLLATFPKTGTTWVTEILRQLLYGNNETSDEVSKMVAEIRGYIETGPPVKHHFLSRVPMERRLIPTHLPADLVNVDKLMKNNAKFIYVTRNPKDTTASLYKFLHSLPLGKNVTDLFPDGFEEFTSALMQGDLPLAMKKGEWYPHHIKSWLKYKGEKSFLFIHFEEIKADPVKAIKKIANFIDCGATDDDVNRVATNTAFDAMKAAKMKDHPEFAKVIMNKGQVGGWQSKFSEDLSRKMDEEITEDLKGFDLDFIY